MIEKGLKGIIMLNINPIFIQSYISIYVHVRMRAFIANVHLAVGIPLNFSKWFKIHAHLKMRCTLIIDWHKCRPGKPAGWEGGDGRIRTTHYSNHYNVYFPVDDGNISWSACKQQTLQARRQRIREKWRTIAIGRQVSAKMTMTENCYIQTKYKQ